MYLLSPTHPPTNPSVDRNLVREIKENYVWRTRAFAYLQWLALFALLTWSMRIERERQREREKQRREIKDLFG